MSFCYKSLQFCTLVLSLCACGFDDDSGENTRCDEDAETSPCAEGEICYRGFCVTDNRCDDSQGSIECFTADQELIGVGVCRTGEQICDDGILSACLGQILPKAEVCNSQDDDCDGTVDEIAGTGCDTGQDGVCGQGELQCVDGAAQCTGTTQSSTELCDAADNDCDGTVDEQTNAVCYPADTLGCEANEDSEFACQGQCAAGVRTCVEGSLSECADAVVPAQTDGCTLEGGAVDDDCDGSVDEDCECELGETQSCYSGPMGTDANEPCQAGTQTCVMGEEGPRFGPCVGEVTPKPETCANDGVDDNCDGTADNVMMRGDSCVDESGVGACRNGTLRCMEDDSGLECVTATPTDEVCNSLDDDCDTKIDEDFALSSDPNNCGMCGAACGEGLDCCGGGCVDTTTNADHCSTCGDACGDGLSCCGAACVDLMSSELSCGACGNSCGDGQTCCMGTCVDTRNDTSHCGVCQMACEEGDRCCGGTCAAATAPACTGCSEDCSLSGLECCDGSCVDPQSDEANCGACGESCGNDQVCCGGTCVTSDATQCGQSCEACTDTELCCTGSCVNNDAANCNGCGVTCSPGSSCCATGCQDLSLDPKNCGKCGNDCGSGDICSKGHCCPSGQTWCDSVQTCVNLQESNNHCGACDDACTGLGCSCSGGNCSGGLVCS